MARLPKNPADAVEQLGIPQRARVLAFGPAKGYVEALAGAVGDDGSVVVWEPPPDLEAPGNAEVVEELPGEMQADAVLVWLGPVPTHSIRDYPSKVTDGGAFWVVFPRRGREAPSPIHEADVKKALLVAGWREDRVVPLSVDAFAVRFRRRR